MTAKIATSFRLTPEVRAWLERNGQALVAQLEQDANLLRGLLELRAEAKEGGQEWELDKAVDFVARLVNHSGK